ncbi:hypothetical protein L798_10117 [Zootermopsis nevadensis]|uniref:Uncharacterized protein n=1 Tax=Zootermopsis nevadensis TaxID=136037 RepID=A0A067R0M9_ZOONE|nr:hypothetical protein L798_10117 [Zootermopsis nevadensis]
MLLLMYTMVKNIPYNIHVAAETSHYTHTKLLIATDIYVPPVRWI